MWPKFTYVMDLSIFFKINLDFDEGDENKPSKLVEKWPTIKGYLIKKLQEVKSVTAEDAGLLWHITALSSGNFFKL